MDEQKICPNCGGILALGHKQKGIVRFDVSEKFPANVWACENCWHDEEISKDDLPHPE